MFTNRFTKIVAVIIIVTLALTTASMISAGPTAGNAVESKEKALREYHLGERYGVTSQDTANSVDLSASDFYQRHPEWTWTVRDTSVVIPVTGGSAFPDYFQRHPELIASAEHPLFDECFDVSLSELTKCRNASQTPVP